MDNKTYTAGKDLIMVEGEIYATEQSRLKTGDLLFNSMNNDIMRAAREISEGIYYYHKVLASTKQLEGIPLLDRGKFVKPFCIEKLIDKFADENDIFECNFQDNGVVDVVKNAFEAGYNANKAEFTKDDIASAILFGVNLVKYGVGITENIIDEEYAGFINSLRPLTLPKLIECDDNYNIIKIEW